MAEIKRGITLFSLGSLYLRGEMNLEDLIRESAAMGFEGYEIVASQMIPSYPFVSDEFVEFTKKCQEKYGIGPVCYAAQMDRGMLRDRDLTEDEMVARGIQDIISANKLGCKVMREQYLLSPGGLARLAPYAEAYDVRVGIEIHNPESPITQAVLDYVAAIEKSGSRYIGFIPDFGCFATKPNKPYWDRALQDGATEEQLERCAQLRYDEVLMDQAFAAMKDDIEKCPALAGALNSMYGFVQFRKDCRRELEGLVRIMPYCFEMHGKFHYMYEDLHEASIPYEEIMEVINHSDFKGYIVTEFEGGEEPLVQCRRHSDMLKKLIRQ
ncbi:sugar phosphate isomerase/epimerase family protein [Lachnoclostridium sp. Marseille-P6806]|uniref:sugar phosphate isomerase/epimerase family protein n=1 Tax=Lachnoclostridium sp. Marseille-P6806 TaxID=2364793 RepID=UPI0010306C82|nr:sugar phosphate isomerase/epimerase [Lachnoclostridium sp. Marseille-P6806]